MITGLSAVHVRRPDDLLDKGSQHEVCTPASVYGSLSLHISLSNLILSFNQGFFHVLGQKGIQWPWRDWMRSLIKRGKRPAYTAEHGSQLVHRITSWDEGVNHHVTRLRTTPGKLISTDWPSTSIHPVIYIYLYVKPSSFPFCTGDSHCLNMS